LLAALQTAQALIRRPSLVIVVSDFLVADGWQSALGKLAQRHEVVAVRLHDPRETELPDVGLLTVEDPETGTQLVVDTSNRGLRERFATAAADQTERLRAALARSAVDRLDVSTDDSLMPVVIRFLNARRVKRRVVGRSSATMTGGPVRS
jgi:uncharacterized protein (DUF58 family)